MSITDSQFQSYVEHVDSKFDVIQEGISSLRTQFSDFDKRLQKVEENTADLPTLRTVVKEHSADIAELKARTANL